ncbi:protein-export chaperone SecB [Alkalilimnicola sp. S0819]|uniref:protein-export chaperone SecB n=1 Tax=Alkalilimnicola sp. S0819 TaxID=2613922 RepID=UPI001261674D|nr:protein-export chaperone SecB [Alkalilimnicola sp. S0819]KAB7622724.1 protein-export chaperone SecB [Alkalilimnicola sp. S0819]MPQ17364.1 protein-export chaperone SecB [Alkalilimnicola sp. S0819]
MAENQPQAGGQEQQAPQQNFNIVKLYLKDCSFEAPNTPDIFQQDWQPQVNVDLNTSARSVAEKTYEVVVSVTVTAKMGEKTAFLVEVQQAGIFQLEGFDQQTLHGLLGAYTPGILFPYAREAVSDLVGKGGFPQLQLNPVNFDALYAKRMAEKQAAEGAGEGSTH